LLYKPNKDETWTGGEILMYDKKDDKKVVATINTAPRPDGKIRLIVLDGEVIHEPKRPTSGIRTVYVNHLQSS
jgi:hypothetical protein